MENKKLSEIRNNLAMLPVLQQRMNSLELTIEEAEQNMQTVLKKYNAEALDVENMKKDSLSNTLLKLFKKFEGKLDKETQEMIEAKLQYDKAESRLSDLRSDKEALSTRISLLLENKKAFEAELIKREDAVRNSITSKVYQVYSRLEAQRGKLAEQQVEIDEAIRVAKNVLATAVSVIEHLESAESWATFDIWARGGIISHMAKYDHIDSAQADINRLSYQLKDLNKELRDIDFFETAPHLGIDSTTRMFDFWFDNIFTDLNVRDKIIADQEEVFRLKITIEDIITHLEENKLETSKELDAIENKKKDLLINNN